jgi:hypothetical protein
VSESLKIALSAAVPIWIADLKKRPLREVVEAMRLGPSLGQLIAEKGDVLLYRSKKAGETARVFNAAAEGIAALSFAPGGVTIFGMHFEATHPDQEGEGG